MTGTDHVVKTLIAVEHSESAHAIVSTAKALFPNAEHRVVSAANVEPLVMTDPLGNSTFPIVPSELAYSAAEEQAEAAVEDARHDLGGGDVTVAVEFGPPGSVICEQAAAHGVDVIVVGRGTKSWVSRLFDPSVADYVIRHAPCPVLVVREPDEVREHSPAESASQSSYAPELAVA